MRILQICAAYKPAFIYGGPTMSVSMLSEQLANAGINVEVYATTANGKEELPVIPNQPVVVDGIKVTYFARTTKDHSHFSPAMLKSLWKTTSDFDVIHIHAWWNLVSLFSCLIAMLRGVPVIVSPRGTLSPYSFQNRNIGIKWFIHHLMGKPLLNRSNIHVTSKREYDAVYQLIKPLSATNIPNFVNLPLDNKDGGKQIGPIFKLIFFSRIEEKKGLDLLLKALPDVSYPFHLTIAGDGDSEYIDALKELAVKNNITDKITWAGFQNENKFELLSQHDLFILPSYDENFGNAVIESLSTGTAVLISEQVGLADYVEMSNLGWICKTNPQSISAAINEIIKNQTHLQKIRRDAPDIIRADFNEDTLTKRYIAMYNKIIKQ